MSSPARHRFAGWVILAAGFAVAIALYVVRSRSADPTMDDTIALGYTRSMQHDMGVMMGHFGVMLTTWQNALATPAGEAALVMVAAVLMAAFCFRVAWVAEHDSDGR